MKIDMPHSCEVTADRLDDIVAKHLTELNDKEVRAFAAVCNALRRIAEEDRIRMETET